MWAFFTTSTICYLISEFNTNKLIKKEPPNNFEGSAIMLPFTETKEKDVQIS